MTPIKIAAWLMAITIPACVCLHIYMYGFDIGPLGGICGLAIFPYSLLWMIKKKEENKKRLDKDVVKTRTSKEMVRAIDDIIDQHR